MKKVLRSITCVVLAMLMFGTQTFANGYRLISLNADMDNEMAANFDESEIYTVFDGVSDLVSYIESNNAVSYNDLKTTNSALIENVSSSAAIAMTTSSGDVPPFISAFLWGCIFNWLGILVVAVTTDFNGHQIKKSAWGCLISSLLWGTFYGSYGYSYY
jgi:hypothetical protein